MNEKKCKVIFVTGASGMIGSQTVKGLLTAGYRVVGVDKKQSAENHENYKHYTTDLVDCDMLKSIVAKNKVDRIVHLAALAHNNGSKPYSWAEYKCFNVDCAKNVFEAAGDIPVLFISTVDVYGFTKEIVCAETAVKPISDYAKSKVLAEAECKRLPRYTIFRFSPVYTQTVKRDIQKRYYLKYPNIAYQIGAGGKYEVLNICTAVEEIVNWCEKQPNNEIKIVKDSQRMDVVDYIQAERKAGRAKIVLKFPRRVIVFGYTLLKWLTGENKYTYLLNKAVYPLESE